VKEAAVVAKEDPYSGQTMIAYIVAKPGNAPTTNELRRFLSARLPAHMIPSSFLVLDAFPRLPSAKLDRQALRMPDNVTPRSDPAVAPPRNDVEWQLAKIFQTVLAVGAVGITDNFFDLGGNSMAALVLLAQIDRTFAKKLPLPTLYQAPTIEELATVLEE